MNLDQRLPEVPPYLNESVIAGMIWGKTHLSGPEVFISGRRESHLPDSALPIQLKS